MNRFEEILLVLAGLATPLVFSVHSIVSMDFATSVIPGWHTTIFPPYFVSGAVFSGFAMVQTLLIIMRKVMNLENYITIKHIENMNIVIIVTPISLNTLLKLVKASAKTISEKDIVFPGKIHLCNR